MKIEVTQCSMCTHYNTEQFCEVWKQYISNDAFYCACGAKADRKTEPTISKMEQVDKDINVRSKTEPQTLDDIGKQIQDAYDKGFLSDADAVQAWYEAVKDEPQTEAEQDGEEIEHYGADPAYW